MKTFLMWKLPLLAMLCVHLCGCSKEGAPAEKEPSITGSPSDPAVEFKVERTLGKSYTYFFESALATQSKHHREGTTARQQEVEFGQTYTVAVTNQLRNGVQQLGLQIQSLYLDVGDEEKWYLNFDSENKAVPPGYDATSIAMQKLLNGKFGVEVTASNRLSKVVGARELIDQALKGGGGRAEGTVRRLFETHMIKQMVGLHHLPDKPLKVGDTCPVEYDIGGSYLPNARVAATYNFRGWQWRDTRKCALLEFSGTIESAPPQSGKPSTSSVQDGKISGRIWFDPELRAVAATSVKQNFTYVRKEGNETSSIPVKQSFSILLKGTRQLDPSQWSQPQAPAPKPVKKEAPAKKSSSTNTVALSKKPSSTNNVAAARKSVSTNSLAPAKVQQKKSSTNTAAPAAVQR